MKNILRGMIFGAAVAVAFGAQADVSVSVSIAPPALPIYVQPPMPGDGYMWTPGYWGWNDADRDYFWVPGTWVSAPYVGALWTPGYWGWGGDGYAWHGGYWGSHIGFYGGVNYGFGYGGVGYQGGYWNNGAFRYNRGANNMGSVHVANVYNTRIVNATSSRVSYNGGRGGMRMQPTRGELSIANMPHGEQTAPQREHEQASRNNQDLRASVNHGFPRVAATPEPGAFNSPGVVASRPQQNERGDHSRGVAMPPQHGQQEMRPGSQRQDSPPQGREPQHGPQGGQGMQAPPQRGPQEMRPAPQANPQRASPQRQENRQENRNADERHDK